MYTFFEIIQVVDISKNEVLLKVQNNLIEETASEFQEKLDKILTNEKDIVFDLCHVNTINAFCLGKILSIKS